MQRFGLQERVASKTGQGRSCRRDSRSGDAHGLCDVRKQICLLGILRGDCKPGSWIPSTENLECFSGGCRFNEVSYEFRKSA